MVAAQFGHVLLKQEVAPCTGLGILRFSTEQQFVEKTTLPIIILLPGTCAWYLLNYYWTW